ncbi:hypothetical protein [Streptomyces ossamyceticus]|uniref:hypothetical protein n=1 Tax=Streptomyces ossamyceticus TaxID=249581 RepID=UPI001969E06A|nr:hypothetical protein [Streptomyces ossamyceticus]
MTDRYRPQREIGEADRLTPRVHHSYMVDPITVQGEAQHRGLLTDSLTPKT